MLPEGFTSRVIGRTGEQVAGHTWHGAPDGGACFADGDGWIYVSNSELENGEGGVSAVRFDSAGEITDAYPILSGTERNCSGGPTPWNTWLSCEETDRGYVFEAVPWGAKEDKQHPAMGRFTHEPAAADPDRKVVYLTEDEPDGCFYRFVPTTWEDMSAGTLQVLADDNGGLAWVDVPDSSAADRQTREQVAAAKPFDGGEGAYYSGGTCYFTAKGENRVYAYDAAANALNVAYAADETPDAPLTGVDNITGAAVGDLYVAEDGGNMEICLITPEDVVAPFLRVQGQDESELCGVAVQPGGRPAVLLLAARHLGRQQRRHHLRDHRSVPDALMTGGCPSREGTPERSIMDRRNRSSTGAGRWRSVVSPVGNVIFSAVSRVPVPGPAGGDCCDATRWETGHRLDAAR